jgi:hypothetical protein
MPRRATEAKSKLFWRHQTAKFLAGDKKSWQHKFFMFVVMAAAVDV